MIVRELSKKDEMGWDDFVEKNNNATFFHQIAWKRLVETFYKFTPVYLMAQDRENIKGILPLFLVKNVFLGTRLISVPFSTIGGICASNLKAENLLIDKAIELTKSLNCNYLELRNLKEIECKRLIKIDKYFTFKLNLVSDTENLWKNLRSTNRRYIRRSKENDFQLILNSNNFQKFYQLFSQGQRNLGTPIQSYKWLENLFYEFPNNHYIAIVEYNGKTIATIFVRYYKNTVSYVFGHSFEQYRHLYPNYILFWELIKDACNKSYEYFDFGRSVKSSGTYYFKSGWRAEPIKLSYQYYLNKAKNIADTSQTNYKRQMFAKVWKKIPVHAANIIGPKIRAYIP